MSCKTCNTNCIEAGTRDDQMCSAWTKRDDAVATDKNVAHKTNADRIRAMTDEELAEWGLRIAMCPCDAMNAGCALNDDTCREAWISWLEKEVRDEA